MNVNVNSQSTSKRMGKPAFGLGGIGNFIQKRGALVALILIFLLASVRYEAFLTPLNLINLFNQNSMIGIVAIGMTFVILSKGIDLSVGSMLALGGITAAFVSPYGLFWALVIPIVVTTLIGMLNGVIISKMKMEPFIVTLAMMIGIRGFVYVVTDQRSMRVDPAVAELFGFFGRGSLFWVPTPIWIFAILLGISGYVLNYTQFGRHVYSLGGNEEASKLMGLRTDRIKVIVYAISGGLSGLAGVVLAARLGGVAQPVAGDMWELDAIAAVVIGGTLLTGGRGNIFGTFVGVMLLGIVLNIINLEGTINSWWQPVIRGVFLLVIVLLQAKILKNKNQKLEES